MVRLFNHYFRRQAVLQVMVDLGLLVVILLSAYLLQVPDSHNPFPAATHGITLAGCLLTINSLSGLYGPSQGRSLVQSCVRAGLALILALPLAYIAFGLLPTELGHREELKWVTIVCIAGVIAHRVYATHVHRLPRTRSRVLIFGSGPPARLVTQTLGASELDVQIVGYVPGPNETQSVVDPAQVLDSQRTLKEQALELKVDEIVVALTERRGGSMPLRELLDCKVAGLRVSDLSTYFERMLCQIRIDHVRAGWLIFGDGFAQGKFRTVAKRLFDIASALLLLVVAAPVMLATAVAIALESKGPIFYVQERVGRNGRSIWVLKFRSMREDAEREGQPQWATRKDSRVTRVGAIIRRFRVDELPQLLNVLKGDMSLVGPRPERPFFVEQLTREIPYYAVRHSVKPGVTGWAQVRYQYGATVEDSLQKLQYDLYYVKNHSIFLDIVILFETIGVVLSGKGAR